MSTGEIDEFLSSINNVTLALPSTVSFITVQRLDQTLSSTYILGAYHIYNGIGGIVNVANENKTISSNITAAVIFSRQCLVNVALLRIFIIGIPNTYENIDISNDKMVASSVIVVSVARNSLQSTPINISLYFRILDKYRPSISAVYSCAFYDRDNVRWDGSGCTPPLYNVLFNRYECSCNRLSTFALVWSPNKTSCYSVGYLWLRNGTCISPTNAQVRYIHFNYQIFMYFLRCRSYQLLDYETNLEIPVPLQTICRCIAAQLIIPIEL